MIKLLQEMKFFLEKKSFLVFLLFYFITLLFYSVTCNAGFVTDFTGFENGYQQCGFWHYYQCGSMPNLRYVQHLFSYVLCNTVGADTIYWYILYCFFHALSAFLGFIVIKKIIDFYKIDNSFSIAFCTALLFLISPYQTEVLVWRVCIQYCFVCIALFLNILLLFSYFKDKKWWKPFLAFLIFAFNMFAIEQAAAIPIVIFGLTIILYWQNLKNIFLKVVAFFVIPQILFIGFYFLLSKLLYQKWIMHYGEKAFQHIISLQTIARFYTYFLRDIFLIRFISNENIKIKIYSFICHPMMVIIFILISLFWLYKLIIGIKNGNKKYSVYLIFLVMYVATLLPVIQLYDSTLLLLEGDRIGYISSFFVYAILAIFVLEKKKKIYNYIFVFILCINAFLLIRMVHYWNISNTTIYSLGNSFNYDNKNEIIALAIPDNFKGIYTMRGNESIKEIAKFRLDKPIHSSINQVAYYNQMSFNDGVKVSKQNDSTLYVSFKQYGNWWWYEFVGMQNYETEKYSVKLDEWCGYYITIKNYKTTNYTFIYADSSKWKEFDFYK